MTLAQRQDYDHGRQYILIISGGQQLENNPVCASLGISANITAGKSTIEAFTIFSGAEVIILRGTSVEAIAAIAEDSDD